MPDEKEALGREAEEGRRHETASGSSSGLEVKRRGTSSRSSPSPGKRRPTSSSRCLARPRSRSARPWTGRSSLRACTGEIDINNFSGPVTLKNIKGNALVHTIKGDIDVTLARVAADKPLSFSTMNGDIDVTLPADVKANLKMKSEQGEIYTDFDINMTRQPAKSEVAEKTEQGKFHVGFDKSLYGIVNGGGQEIGVQHLQRRHLHPQEEVTPGSIAKDRGRPDGRPFFIPVEIGRDAEGDEGQDGERVPEALDQRVDEHEQGRQDEDGRRHRIAPSPVGPRQVGALLPQDEDPEHGQPRKIQAPKTANFSISSNFPLGPRLRAMLHAPTVRSETCGVRNLGWISAILRKNNPSFAMA